MSWSKPVEVNVHGPGAYRIVPDTRQAAECLMNLWPVSEGQKFEAALRAVTAALDGDGTDDDARAAFIEAAMEAGLNVRDGPASSTERL